MTEPYMSIGDAEMAVFRRHHEEGWNRPLPFRINGKPILIDLYCCAGGATKGYQRAGFFVIGVDKDPQPNYCGDAFIQMDALQFLARLAANGRVHPFGQGVEVRLTDIAAFHGSPPCQANTALTKGNREREGWEDTHVDLIPETRDFFEWFGLPYVIENTQGATMRRDLVVCGHKHFGLRMFRHRYFELGGWSMPEMYCNGSSRPGGDHHGERVAGVRHGVTYEGRMLAIYGDGGGKGSFAEWEEAMGIDWVTVGSMKERKKSLAEALPPVYTEHIGLALMDHLRPRTVAQWQSPGTCDLCLPGELCDMHTEVPA